MNWDWYIYFSFSSVLFWALGSWSAYRSNIRRAYGFMLFGLLLFGSFIAFLWSSLDRPPLCTIGETRLWYSFFLPLVGLITYARWHYKWVLIFSTLLSFVFVCINLLHPEIQNKSLMPALQSLWFIPHVILYMFAYAMLGASTALAVHLLLLPKQRTRQLLICDHLVCMGLSFMTLGMLCGGLWAKDAWGHYWSWDPKETWAAITWFSYLIYVHMRIGIRNRVRLALYVLLISFLFLQMCWWGINYLPASQGSIHTLYVQRNNQSYFP